MKSGNDIINGAFLYKPGVVYTQGDFVSHNGILYVVVADEATEEPEFGSRSYQEYAYNVAVKDKNAVMDGQSEFRVVSGRVMEELLSDALAGLNGDNLNGKLAKMRNIAAYESLSFTLDSKVTYGTSGTSFTFQRSSVPDADITELDVFVMFAPTDLPQNPSRLIYMQEMLRCVLTDRGQVYANNSEYVGVATTLSNDTYTVSLTPYMNVTPNSLRIVRIEGVGTIVSEPIQS